MRRMSFWLAILVILSISAVAALAALTYRNTAFNQLTEALDTRSTEIRQSALRLLSDVKDAETGQRGFLLSGSPDYLEPYFLGISNTDGDLERLRALLADRSEYQVTLAELSALIETKKEELAQTIDIRRNASEEEFRQTRQIVMTDEGLVNMRQIRNYIARIVSREEQLAEQRHLLVDQRASASKRMILGGNLLAVTLLAATALVAIVDRRKRARAEHEMKRGAAELEAIVDSVTDGIVAFDADLRIRRMNPAAAAIHRCDPRLIVGQSKLQFVPERMRDDFTNDIRDFLQSTDAMRQFTEGVAMRVDGQEFPTAGTLTKSHFADQSFLTLMFNDLTERRAGIEAKRERDALLDQIRDAIHVCDMHDTITYWNHGAENLYGIAAKDAIGSNAVDLLYATSAESWFAGRQILLKNGLHTAELAQVTKSGREVVVEHRRSLIRSDDGQPTGQLVINVDITQRKKEDARKRHSQRLESIGTLAGGIAHDLNNVLTPVMMSGKLLARSDRNREQHADTIVKSAERGTQMIRKLLSFAGGGQKVQECVDLNQVVAETRQILEHTLPKEILLDVQVGDNVHAVIGDSTELAQVLMNLAINARDAMPEGGRLEMRLQNVYVDAGRAEASPGLEPGDYVIVTVTDSGTGMPKAVLDRIFDPFFTTKGQGKGTGLGLATSMGIIRSHGGEISVYSEPGKGTQFTIYLPAAALPNPRFSPREEEDDRPVQGSGETILLVDDEQLILETARVVLEANGYLVRVARSGVEAISIYQDEQSGIDLAVVDMMMPGLNGVETKAGLRAINANLPVIATSGLRRPADESGPEENFNGFLPKPYSDDQLLRVVRHVLDAFECSQTTG